ncbi:MAG TPA: BsuPI-related putative proteinase inhibitor [Gemmatimonadales bacterium]|nr:BsuPI-related putative proteinase inhibitor [Gemmatimonadales bacterium]
MKLFCGGTFVVLAALACSQPVGLTGATGLRSSATVDRDSISSGQRVNLTVTLTNSSPDPVTLHLDQGCASVLPYVSDVLGKVLVPSGGWVCPAELTTLSFAPGESKQWTFAWAGGSLSPSELPEAGGLPPGEYYFYATLAANEGTYTTPRFLIHLQ